MGICKVWFSVSSHGYLEQSNSVLLPKPATLSRLSLTPFSGSCSGYPATTAGLARSRFASDGYTAWRRSPLPSLACHRQTPPTKTTMPTSRTKGEQRIGIPVLGFRLAERGPSLVPLWTPEEDGMGGAASCRIQALRSTIRGSCFTRGLARLRAHHAQVHGARGTSVLPAA